MEMEIIEKKVISINHKVIFITTIHLGNENHFICNIKHILSGGLMNIIAFMPATKAYEILLRNGGGDSEGTCCTWEEDYQRNFITFIPLNVPYKNEEYYCFPCSSFDELKYDGAYIKNGILTYQTIDSTTTYWIHLGSNFNGAYEESYKGGYNEDACFMLTGKKNVADIEELSYDDCKKIRDP
ncbi:hypothetical protein C1646_671067 [Rhizophagus diaphanus]|nr:hypothetical protein C1646_671067 [Rhizophagus diaphanus] [Rhizophagus sp. MUCL 43196]